MNDTIINIITDYYNYYIDINAFTNETENTLCHEGICPPNKEKINHSIKEEFNKISKEESIIVPNNYKISFFTDKDIQEALQLYHITNNNSNTNNDKELSNIIIKYDYYLNMKNKTNFNHNQKGGNSKINLLGKRRNIINKKGKLYVTIKGELVSLKKAKLMHIKYINNKTK